MENKIQNYLVAAESAFKKIGRILRDKRLVSFELSIKLWRKSGKPNEFSIEGSRSTDGGWTLHLPPDPNLRVPKSPTVLNQRFSKIEQSVRDYLAENALDGRWAGLEKSIKEQLQSGLSVDDFLCSTGLPIQGSSGSGYDAPFAAPIIATAYAIAGARALADGDLSRASYCSGIGLYWSSPKMLIPNPRERYKARASAGGKEKSLRYEPVKDKVAELLMTMTPSEGWKSLEQAIGHVADKLAMCHSQLVKETGLTTDGLDDTIRRWIRKDPARFPCRIKPRARYPR
ncbi:hypothetical protein [Burkholderia ubonensis]|uniref:hypothetical protein n=1 Tax=Burkholderia ubonensis TaxID=101571 RepID=UPI002ABD7FB2|nr:hypothetical protein [Burkholderia ubonensis]